MVTAEYFDDWYVDIDRSSARQRLFTEHLGLPTEIGPANMVPLDGLKAIGAAVDLPVGGLLVDLACGRGGPGMFLAREAGCRLVGVDFSPEAVRQASGRRELFDLGDRASCVVGDLGATGLAAGVADAVVCIDAVQFAASTEAAAAEMWRLLKPGGHVAVTCWQPLDANDGRFPDRLRGRDVAGALRSAGFSDVESSERPDWQAAERALWAAVDAIDPGDDPALVSLQDEGRRMAPLRPATRRLLLTATKSVAARAV